MTPGLEVSGWACGGGCREAEASEVGGNDEVCTAPLKILLKIMPPIQLMRWSFFHTCNWWLAPRPHGHIINVVELHKLIFYSKDYYFDSYAHFGIHEEMLKDEVKIYIKTSIWPL